jgi:Domain of unknown function (DUF4329)
MKIFDDDYAASESNDADRDPQNPTPTPPVLEQDISISPKFTTDNAAAIAAIDRFNATSIQQNLEYAGMVCAEQDKTIRYTLGPASARTSDSSDTGVCPANTIGIADWHSHAATDPKLVSKGIFGIGSKDHNETFSRDDKISNNRKGIPGYLGTPKGAILLFVPGAPGKQHSTKGDVFILRKPTL